jgi:hypothetical protein
LPAQSLLRSKDFLLDFLIDSFLMNNSLKNKRLPTLPSLADREGENVIVCIQIMEPLLDRASRFTVSIRVHYLNRFGIRNKQFKMQSLFRITLTACCWWRFY